MAHVLLLNATSEPLAVVSPRRAVSLLLRGCVEAACDESYELRGSSRSFCVPTVVRLRRYVNAPQRGLRWTRRGVLQRDRYTCAYCGVHAGDHRGEITLARRDMTIDHIIPLSRGGKSTWSNTVCACGDCNRAKGNRTPYEANMHLGWEPKRPRVTYWVVSGDVPAEWKVYLLAGGSARQDRVREDDTESMQ